MSATAVFLPVALKLSGVITWSWWWVLLSPLWISLVLPAIAITVLAIQPIRQAKPWLAREAADHGAGGGDLGFQDDV